MLVSKEEYRVLFVACALCQVKCMFSTAMLAIFVVLSVVSVKFYLATFGEIGVSRRYDYIIVGSGPAGSVLVGLIVRIGAGIV